MVFFATTDVNQWFSLGLALGLHYPTLEKIEMEKEKRMQIQTRIDDLERIIKDSKDQLLSME